MKLRAIVLLFCLGVPLAAEVHTLTLRQCVNRALHRNPDLVMARLKAEVAARQVEVAKDPFFPKVYVGSGLAYTNGFPMSVEGSAPSVVQARSVASILNRPLRYQLSQAREEAQGAKLDSESRRETIVLRTAELYLECRRRAKTLRTLRAERDGLKRVEALMEVRRREGRELPVAVKQAQLDVARAAQRVEIQEAALADCEGRLAAVLGFPAGDQVRAAAGDLPKLSVPISEREVVRAALHDNSRLRRLQSELVAKGYQIKAAKAARLPRVSLVAQYGLFAKFNNYEDFFNRFQRSNGQIGVSVEVPLYVGPAAKAKRAQAEIEVERLRAQLSSTRSRIVLDAKKAYRDVQQAETAVKVARLDLEVARENLDVLLAKMGEGRASLKQVEAARYLENEKWIAFYDAHQALVLARFRLLSKTGRLLAALSAADYSG